MTLFALIALFGWIPFVVVLFAIMPVRQAAAVAVIGAWLLLPPINLPVVSLPDFSKNVSAAIAIVLGTVLFGGHFVLRFRPRWFDLPMILWCCCPIGTSLHNGLGLYDGLAGALATGALVGAALSGWPAVLQQPGRLAHFYRCDDHRRPLVRPARVSGRCKRAQFY